MIYLDHNATTPLHPAVRDVMLRHLEEGFGNPSSVHAAGARARVAVEEARAQVASLVDARPADVVFTSGGTESNNLAIYGLTRAGRKGIVVTAPIEHSSVLEPIRFLQEDGYDVRFLPVDSCGRVDPEDVAATLAREPAALVSVGWANNEVGTLQRIAEIGRACRSAGVPFHVDAVQALGKVPMCAGVADAVSLSAHKIGGPKGVGALVVREDVALVPLLRGGGQERDRRAGTENVAGIAGMGAACRLAGEGVASYARRCGALRDRLWAALSAALPGIVRNGPSGTDCLANTLNVTVPGVRGEALVAALDLEGVAVSSGSACAAGAGEPSHVLAALGADVDAARDGVRFSVGTRTTSAEVDRAIEITATCVQRMQALADRRVARA